MFNHNHKMIARGSALLATLLLCLIQPGYAAQSDNAYTASKNSRPKIGLALSGGGARGAAHVGILKILEQNNIPIDYIAGTSMGAVMGALYATGMTADEINEALKEIEVKPDCMERRHTAGSEPWS